MAVTWTVSGGTVFEGVAVNGKRQKRCILSATGTYTTGGDSLPPATVGLKGITAVYVLGDSSGVFNPGFSVSLAGTPEAPLLRADVAATGGSGAVAQVAGAVSLTGKLVNVVIEGY